MMSHKETHKGYEIVIENDESVEGQSADSTDGAAPVAATDLKIGNISIEVSEGEPGQFSTNHLPYTTYESIVDLAKAVIDDSAEFDTLSEFDTVSEEA